jgi:hypothetical protein
MAGEFTRKINQEFLSKKQGVDPEKLRKEEAERRKQELANKAEERTKEELRKIMDLFKERVQFLTERFPNMKKEECENPLGIRFSFKKDAQHRYEGVLEFRCKANDSYQALFVETTLEVLEKFSAKNDYITFAINKVQEERIRKFIESKILAFVQEYI